MPIFEYQCKSCMRTFEEVVFDASLPSCPHCSSGQTEKCMSRPCKAHCARDSSASSYSGGVGSSCGGCSGGSCSSCGHG